MILERMGSRNMRTTCEHCCRQVDRPYTIAAYFSRNNTCLCLPVLKDQLAGNKLGDADSTRTVLQLVRNFAETWPGVFENGEATGIGLYIFALFPPLTFARFHCIHEDLVETIETLLGLLLAKDVWAGRALLADAHHLCMESFRCYRANLQGSPLPNAAKHTCFMIFWEELKSESEGETCVIDLSIRENCLIVHSAATRIVKKMLIACPQFLSDMAW